MTGFNDPDELLQVDVEQVLFAKNPDLAKKLPGFLINYLKRIVHQDEINSFLKIHGHLRDAAFIEAGLKYFGIRYNVCGRENLPASGRYFFVSNHPLGGLDGLVFISELSHFYPVLKFPVNDILMAIKNLDGIFVPINKHGSQGRMAVKMIEDAYASDAQILYFPAGLCSRKRKGVIRDLPWHKSFIAKAVQHNRDIVPAYFSGRNSDFFYNLSNVRKFLGINSNIEMLYLADEMFRQKNKEIDLVFGKPLPVSFFDNSRTPGEWAGWIRDKCYELESFIPLKSTD